MTGRDLARLLTDFGHHPGPQPPPARPVKEAAVFTKAWSWRGPARPGAGWAAATAPVKRYDMTSDQAGLFWPWTAPAPTPPTGAPMGIDIASGATFYIDPHGWVLDPRIPVTNPNILLFGKPGRGKSAWVKTFLNRMFGYGYKALILGDVKDEYEQLCRCYGVEPIAIGPGLPARLNPLDPGPLAQGWDQLDPAEQQRRAAIIQARWLLLLRNLIGCQTIAGHPVPVGPSEEQLLKTVLDHLTGTNQPHRRPAQVTLPQIWHLLDNPPAELIGQARFPDRQRFLDGTRLLRDAIAQLTSGVLAGMFDDHTTIRIDWDAPIASLSLSRLSGLGDQAVGIALACLSSWGTSIRDNHQTGGRINVRDEAWKQLRLGPDAVAAFDADLRLSRAHGDIEIAVAHKPGDYQAAGQVGSQAQAIARDLLHLADIKVLYGQDAATADDLEGLLGLGRPARDAVTGWAMNQQGRALVCIGPRLHQVQLTLHPDLEAPLTATNHNLHQP